MKTLSAVNDNLIDQTRPVWQPRLGHDINREDARQIAENVTGFFSVLAEWARAEKVVPANETDTPTEISPVADDEGVRHDR